MSKTDDVKSFDFPEFATAINSKIEAQDFLFRELSESVLQKPIERSKIIKAERERAQDAGFMISPIVREYRGMVKQEVEERERRIDDEVQKRIELMKQDAFEQGFNEGVEQGKAQVYEQTRKITEEKMTYLTQMIHTVLSEQEELLAKEKQEAYRLIRNLTKWVILRELKDDGQYLNRLLEKLISELGSRQNLLIQVNRAQFDQMPEILESVQKKLGELKNVRIETDDDVSANGFIIESENGIINGTIEEQFKSLDRLFEVVGLEGEDGSKS